MYHNLIKLTLNCISIEYKLYSICLKLTIGVYKFKRSESRSMLTSYSTLLKVSDRDIQNLNDQHPDRCQIKQPECILFGQSGSHFFTLLFDTDWDV